MLGVPGERNETRDLAKRDMARPVAWPLGPGSRAQQRARPGHESNRPRPDQPSLRPMTSSQRSPTSSSPR
jgi:hypothetical protein